MDLILLSHLDMNSTSGNVSKNYFSGILPENTKYYSLIDRSVKTMRNENFDFYPIWFGSRLFVSQVSLTKFIFSCLNDIVNLFESKYENKKEVRIIVTLSSPYLVFVAHELKEKGFDIRPLMWDCPSLIVQNFHLFPLYSRKYNDSISDIIQSSKSSAYVSHEMLERYSSGDSDALVIYNSLPRELFLKRLVNYNHDNIQLGFAGSIYAIEEFLSLIAALSKYDFKILGKDVYINVWGHIHKSCIVDHPNIKYYGHLSVEMLISSLNECHIAYLPYWFSSTKSDVVETSFPGKMTTYIAANVKVFYHGPKKSTVTRFMSNYSVGVCCHSLDSIDIIEQLETLVEGDFDFSSEVSKLFYEDEARSAIRRLINE
ncbi:hypothetical protein AKJ18_04735 [Vibrio xuii]|nr:hypothetical protein AKJ18_04735 [Vibrio xuii]